jgi:metal-sulfur cluster biosynthetic enzyme
MPVTPKAILEALKAVAEPCSIAMRRPMDITEMGLVQDVLIEGGDVEIVLILTDPSCVHFTSMRQYIADVLLPLEGIDTVKVTMSTTALWTPDRVKRRGEPAPAGA